MRIEYLLFNLLVLFGPLLMSFERNLQFRRRWPRAGLAIAAVAGAYIGWDIAVAGRHWWFNHDYTLSMRLLGLPLGEWLFFVTVPFACLFIWETLKHYRPLGTPSPRWSTLELPLAGLIGGAGGMTWFIGLEYTGLALVALGVTLLLDHTLHTSLLGRPLTRLYALIILALVLVFNLYLTARPVVLYGEDYYLGLRIITIPLEDFIYGLSLVLSTVVVYEYLGQREETEPLEREGRADG